MFVKDEESDKQNNQKIGFLILKFLGFYAVIKIVKFILNSFLRYKIADGIYKGFIKMNIKTIKIL